MRGSACTLSRQTRPSTLQQLTCRTRPFHCLSCLILLPRCPIPLPWPRLQLQTTQPRIELPTPPSHRLQMSCLLFLSPLDPTCLLLPRPCLLLFVVRSLPTTLLPRSCLSPFLP